MKFAPVIVTVLRPVVGPPRGLTAVTVAGATVRVAPAVLPVPPLVEETEVLLLQTPGVVPVTSTTTWQLELAAIDPPLSEIEPDPAVAVALCAPHVSLSPFGVATTNPDGSASVNPTPSTSTVFADGLVIVNVNDVVPFNGTVAAPNARAIDGGPTTVSVAWAVFPVPPLSEETATMLFLSPAVPPGTMTANSQPVSRDRPPGKRNRARALAIAVRVPPQALRQLSPGGG